MKMISLARSTSTTRTTALITKPPSTTSSQRPSSSGLLHSFFHFLLHRRNPFPAFSLPALRRKLTGTLFGFRHGHVTFSLQLDPRGNPLTPLHLDISTTALLNHMSSGLLRIALHSHKLPSPARPTKLLNHPTWTMHCNGTETGRALYRTCEPYDRHLLNTIRTVSVGAGVIPVLHDGSKGGGGSGLGELVYMRAEFERVVGGGFVHD